MRLDGKERLNYVVEGKLVRGPREKLFFERDSGLLMRWDMVRRSRRPHDREPSVVDAERGAMRATLKTFEIVAHRYNDMRSGESHAGSCG